jgi:TM2 domain-containing membrane protein YozV
MSSPWISVLLKPAEACSALMHDDESPVLVVVPLLAGIGMLSAWVATYHTLMTVPTQAGFVLLVGPPMVLVSSWWGRLCISGVGKLLGGRVAPGALASIIAWSWLPLLYLSLLAVAVSRVNPNGELLMSLQVIGVIWQLVIIGAALRKTLAFTLWRTIFLMLISLLSYLFSVAVVGYGLGTLFNGWFKMVGMV